MIIILVMAMIKIIVPERQPNKQINRKTFSNQVSNLQISVTQCILEKDYKVLNMKT